MNYELCIKKALPFVPTAEQVALIHALAEFVQSRADKRCFVLRGYSGTGKTSILAALVQALHKLHCPTVLLAPTGRAAKVLSRYSGFDASTIHRAIYRQSKVKDTEALFSLGYNKGKDTLFIVDEASMLATTNNGESSFGSGNVLDDLIHFVYQGANCSLLLVGDDAQLPPVGQSFSPALQVDYLRSYGLQVHAFTLTQVIRQALTSGILTEATRLRAALSSNAVPFTYRQIDTHDDLIRLQGAAVQETLERSYREVGIDETLIITRSNKRTNLYNQGIRARILQRDELLAPTDDIMVSRNNYFWQTFIANGESLALRSVRNERELYGYHFADGRLVFADKPEEEISATLWLDTLLTDTPEASYMLQRDLYYKIAADYPEIRSRKKLRNKVIDSPYYNALQIRYAYAVTCHKAQGGQWAHVYIDAGALTGKSCLTADEIRWLYTALTRATEKVYLLR